jgi:hypothetical protein
MELAIIPATLSSFPRKRESTLWTFGNALSEDWIPAFAGMTGGAGMLLEGCGSSTNG